MKNYLSFIIRLVACLVVGFILSIGDFTCPSEEISSTGLMKSEVYLGSK